MNYELIQYPDGIYFDMPFDTYIVQEAFSNSMVDKINSGVLNYWEDEIAPKLDPDFDLSAHIQESTKSMVEGAAWHVMALEGKDRFDTLYASGYDPSVYPKAIKSGDEHREACVQNGLSDKGTIAAMWERLVEAKVDIQSHIDLKERHDRAADGKIILTINQMEELQRAGEIMRQYGVDKTMLQNGFPEVSILVTLRGVRFKCRVDYLRPDMQIEYKTFSRKSRKKPLEEVCAAAMHDYGYFTSAYIYSECVRAAREELSRNTNFAKGMAPDAKNPEWLSEFVNASAHEYWFLFQERGKYNHVLPRRFDKYDEALQSRKLQRMWKTGKIAVERAVSVFNWYMENNGLEKRWLPDLNPKPWDDTDFRPWQIVEE